MPSKPVSGGQRLGGNLSATEWNSVRTRNSRAATRDLSFLAGAASEDAVDGIVTIKNTSGRYLAPGAVVGLDAPFILPSQNLTEFKSTIQFSGAIPTEAHTGKFGILLDGCPPEGFAPATIHGVVWANVAMQAATDKYADVQEDNTSALRSGALGAAQILYHFPQGSTYPQTTVAYVRLSNLGSSGLVRARMTMDLTDDYPLATAHDWDWDAEEEEYFDTERQVELRCFLRPEGETIANRTRVLYTVIGGIKEIVVVNCDPDPEEETP